MQETFRLILMLLMRRIAEGTQPFAAVDLGSLLAGKPPAILLPRHPLPVIPAPATPTIPVRIWITSQTFLVVVIVVFPILLTVDQVNFIPATVMTVYFTIAGAGRARVKTIRIILVILKPVLTDAQMAPAIPRPGGRLP